MLVTQQPVLRRFWYPVVPTGNLTDKPFPFTLLGEDIVLWRDAAGAAQCILDRCCHRSAKLSKGWVQDGHIVCGYHGWEYDGTGQCVRIPQMTERATMPGARTPGFKVQEKYDYVWVTLSDDPLDGIPDLHEAEKPGFRQIHEFYEEWDCAGLRLMENSFDNAHFSFVHRASFGDQGHPEPAKLEITESDTGFHMYTEVPVRNPEIQMKNLGMENEWTVRHMDSTWFIPFTRALRITYPNGLFHMIFTSATPIDDERSMVCQFVVRSDTEADAPAENIVAFDRQVTNEDMEILASTSGDVPLDVGAREEIHMRSDRPGVLMRQKMKALLEAHGETEVRAEPSVALRRMIQRG
jgi:phenylpropionate dioxygenase-like ring-hydroxylating dioxygenase large terminal subunit